jgi:hypothetical protein
LDKFKELAMKMIYLMVCICIIVIFPKNLLAEDVLLQSKDFHYLGAFRVPKSDMGGPLYHGLAYGGAVIAYNPVNNSLYITGHDSDQLVAEISIPQLVKSSVYSTLNTATILQNLVDITEGNRRNIKIGGVTETANAVKIGGVLQYGGKILGSVYNYYDGGFDAVYSHFFSGTTFATLGDFQGMFEVGTKPEPVPQAGFVGGYMTPIPSNWQVALGGKIITGQSALSVIGRTSLGPAAFAFDPDKLGVTPAPATALLYYPNAIPTLGAYQSSYMPYSASSHYSGVIFPSGTRSIVYAGRHGLGEFCYGIGTTIQSENGNRYNYPPPNNTCNGTIMTELVHPCCYDPVNLTKGSHNYPYVENQIWAYDANDLVRVKAGGRIVDNPTINLVDGVSPSSKETYKPWHIKPYAMWNMPLPSPKNDSLIFTGAMAYDETHQLLYLSQATADSAPFQKHPVIHVYKLTFPPPSMRIEPNK